MRLRTQDMRRMKRLQEKFEVACAVGHLVTEVTRDAHEELKKELNIKWPIIAKLRQVPNFKLEPSEYKWNPVLNMLEESYRKHDKEPPSLINERLVDLPLAKLQAKLDTIKLKYLHSDAKFYHDVLESSSEEEEEVDPTLWDSLLLETSEEEEEEEEEDLWDTLDILGVNDGGSGDY